MSKENTVTRYSTAPTGGLTRDSVGNFYGTTQKGGRYNAGVVYKMGTSGQETQLYSFTGGVDGKYPSECRHPSRIAATYH